MALFLIFLLLFSFSLFSKSEIVAPPSTSLKSFSQEAKAHPEPLPDIIYERQEQKDVLEQEEQPFELPTPQVLQ